MTQRNLRRALGAALACAAIPALAPAVASASTFTVDDDHAQCPSAAFTSIQAAVDQAAPWDTIVVCDGLYEEQSRPASGAESPSAPNSTNGLTITKPLTIKGAGASKVTIRPKSSLQTLAGDTPYLRDGGGNVVTVSKQSRDSTDVNTMFVDISGVTIDSPTTYAEAGVAFFDANGAIRNSVVGPLRRAADAGELAARPHGWGVVMTNHYQGAEAGPHREVSIENSLVTGYQSGGVLFDDARGPDGDPTTLQRSGIVQYGYVRNSTIQGSGPDGSIPQTGVEYHSGQRGLITRSTVTGNYFTPDPRRSVGVLLTDAETGADPAGTGQRGFYAYDNVISGNGYGLFNATAANDAVRPGAPAAATAGAAGLENYWGCRTGALVGAPSADGTTAACQGISGDDVDGDASVELGPVRAAPQIFPADPGATPDAAPAASFADPVAGGTVTAGQPVDPVVSASDDFGVRVVSLTLDGQPVGAIARAPYEFAGGWTPGYDQLGTTHTLQATVVDSAGQEVVTTADVTVVPPAGYAAASVDAASLAAGSVTLGSTADRTVTVTNSGRNPLTLGSLSLTGAGFATAGGTCAPGAQLAVGAGCTVVVRFAPTVAGAATGTLSIPYSAIGAGAPLTVALSGTGVALPVPVSTKAPAIRGRASVGATLTCQPGSWSGTPTGYAYRWLRNGAAIARATRRTYKLVQADTGASIRCSVVASNAGGASVAARSGAVSASFASVTTKTTVAKQAGASIVTFVKAPKASRGGVLTVAKVRYVGRGAATVRASGTLKVGSVKLTFASTHRIRSGKTATIAVRLSASARKTLAKHAGTLTVKVSSSGGKSGSASVTVTVKRA